PQLVSYVSGSAGFGPPSRGVQSVFTTAVEVAFVSRFFSTRRSVVTPTIAAIWYVPLFAPAVLTVIAWPAAKPLAAQSDDVAAIGSPEPPLPLFVKVRLPVNETAGGTLNASRERP